MNIKELSLEFDIMFNNVMSGKAPGLNEYEKSVFLTKGQEEILKNYFNPKGNKYQEGVSDSPKRIVDFSPLIIVSKISGATATDAFFKNTKIYTKPNNIFLPLSFKLRDNKSNELIVIPIKDEEIQRLSSKPYKEPFKGYGYLVDNSTTTKNYEIIVGKSEINKDYSLYMRYVKYPSPIILVDLSCIETEFGLESNTLSINGIRAATECKLNPEIHKEILDRAVNLAKVHFEGDTQGIIQYSESKNE